MLSLTGKQKYELYCFEFNTGMTVIILNFLIMIHKSIFCSFPLNSFLIYNAHVYSFVLSRHKPDTVGHHGSCGFDKYKEWMTASAQPASNDGVRTQLFSYYQKKIQFLFCLTKLHAEDLLCLINWGKTN